MVDTYYDLVRAQKTARSELDTRMQDDTNLLYLDKYILRDVKGLRVSDIVNVTLNRPAVFAANVISSLGTAKQQVLVESEDQGLDASFIEEFLDLALRSADRRLYERGLPLLGPFADTQLCIRGRTARRVLLRQEEGEFICDITPWDGRYVYFEKDIGGLKWAAYETPRTKRDVEAEYGEGISPMAFGGESSVLDVWDRGKNEVWIDGKLIKTIEHDYGFVPVVFQIVQLGYGPMLLDMGWQKREGESIFFMIRSIVPELNRLASILQTLNMNQLKAALQYQNPEGTPQDEPPDRPEMGDVVSVGKGRIETINLGEAKQAALQMYQIIEKAFQEGSYTDIDIGNVRQPFSAVALITIGESRDTVYMPRLAAKELLNVATSEMAIKQALQIGGTIELGTPGHKRKFKTSSLKGEYEIHYKYFIKNPKTDVALMAIAQQAQAYYPRRKILEEVLQDKDPDGTLADRYAEMAETVDPNVLRFRIIQSLLEKAKKGNIKAKLEERIMRQGLRASLMQTKMGQLPPERKSGQKSEKSIVPLLGEGGKTGGPSTGPAPELPQEAMTEV